MGPKKGDKGKKKGEKSSRPTKTQYNILVAENNVILGREKINCEAAEESFLVCEKRYEQVQEDAADIIKYLQHEIEENEAEVAIFNIKIGVLNKEIKQTDKYYEAIFSKMESAYEEKNMELQHQIQQINAKLFASEETKQQREEYLQKKKEYENMVKEMEIRHDKEIYIAERMAIIKQDTMQKDMETHLNSLIVDFRQASDFAIGETINKLVRDNITLGNMLTCMQETVEKARENYDNAYTEEINLKYNAELIEKEHSMILKRHDARLFNIETIIKSQEDLYERIRSSQKLIKGNRRLQRQIAEEECILREKIEDVKYLLRVLAERESALSAIESSFYSMRRELVRLDTFIFESAKRLKEAIDVENLTRLEDEMEGESKEDQEENLIEFKYKTRETAIDEVINKMAKELTSENENYLAAASTESHIAQFAESFSTQNNLNG